MRSVPISHSFSLTAPLKRANQWLVHVRNKSDLRVRIQWESVGRIVQCRYGEASRIIIVAMKLTVRLRTPTVPRARATRLTLVPGTKWITDDLL